jgi:phosphomannomutase
VTDVFETARTWIAGDPDPTTRAELQSLIDDDDLDELESRFSGKLSFGTAGIRGEVGAGPTRMNRAVVIRTTAGLAQHLIESHGQVPHAPVVVGFDARPTSRQFAEDTAGVLAAAGLQVIYFEDVVPTPIVAFAAKHLGAAAAVVVTASHNPPADNGYKVYAGNAAQIVPPMDAAIASAIDRAPPANEIPRIERVFSGSSTMSSPAPMDILDRYWDEVDASRPQPTPSGLKIVYTAMHGVGGETVRNLMARAGHTGLLPVPSQFEPDGTFPTVRFPNPEERGALDLAKDLADAEEADLIIANDPDADRLAAMVPSDEGWRPLSGNELGVLLGDYVLRHHTHPDPAIVVNSIVSSPMLGRLAASRGARHEVTLTGFKWIMNAGLALEEAGEGVFVFGYEEALGYAVGPTVRDKDGISAAVVFSDLVAGLKDGGYTVLDRLAELWELTGVWASAQHSVVRSGDQGEQVIAEAVSRLAESPPASVSGYTVDSVTDFRVGAETRPQWLGAQALVELSLGERGRALVRPSGTEPKLKFYVDLTGPAGADPIAAQGDLTDDALGVAEELARFLGV